MSDIRSRLGSLLDQTTDEDLKTLILDSLSAEKLKWSYCPNCKKKVQADFPDIDKRAKALAMLLDQSKGKPAETKKVEMTLDKQLAEMTDEELAAFAAGG